MSRRRAGNESLWWWLGQLLALLFWVTMFVVIMAGWLVVAPVIGTVAAVSAIAGHRAFARDLLSYIDFRDLWRGRSL